ATEPARIPDAIEPELLDGGDVELTELDLSAYGNLAGTQDAAAELVAATVDAAGREAGLAEDQQALSQEAEVARLAAELAETERLAAEQAEVARIEGERLEAERVQEEARLAAELA